MNRKPTIDLLRGFIMVLMAIDHVMVFNGPGHFSEPWGLDFSYYTTIGGWFSRFVTHFCAPGFFFLMGMSMILFSESRQKKGWSMQQILQYFWKRAGVILLCMLFLEFPAWGLGFLNEATEVGMENTGPGLPGDAAGNFFFPTTVLYGLAICMAVGSFLHKAKNVHLLLVTLLSFAFSGWYISSADPTAAQNPLAILLFVPNISSGMIVIYPLIPWLGVTTLGMFWARLMKQKREQIYSISLITGFVFLGIFVLLRFMEWGNFQKGSWEDMISFFTLIKYPPSVVFILLTCGVNLILFFLFSKVEVKGIFKLILLFGQTAMFFYLAHLLVYALSSFAFPNNAIRPIVYLVWLVGLVPLYYACRWFLNFKKGKPENSIWRMI